MVARPRAPFSPRAPIAAGFFASAALLVTAACACSCGEQPDAGAPAGATAPASDEAPASTEAASQSRGSSRGGRSTPVTLTAEEPYESSELGALHGTILFAGEAPARFELGAASNAECKHHPEVDQRSNEIVVNGGKLAGVFVTLASGFDKAHVPPASDAVASLEQKGCMYVPRVLALRVGQTLRVSNDDPTNHNVHTFSKRNSATNKNMGAKQPPLEFRFDKAEYPVPFQCDIHPWMGAAVFVEEHPWFAVTDEQGAFRIRDVP